MKNTESEYFCRRTERKQENHEKILEVSVEIKGKCSKRITKTYIINKEINTENGYY